MYPSTPVLRRALLNEQQQSDEVGKVFVVTSDMRGCVICGDVFSAKQAVEHWITPWFPTDSHKTCLAVPPNLRERSMAR